MGEEVFCGYEKREVILLNCCYKALHTRMEISSKTMGRYKRDIRRNMTGRTARKALCVSSCRFLYALFFYCACFKSEKSNNLRSISFFS